MRIRLVMRDIEYSKALMNAFQRYNQDLYVEISGDFSAGAETLIVTDYNIKHFDRDILEQRRGGVVFVLSREVPETLKTREFGPFFIFKYDGVDKIMAALNLSYCIWHGDEEIRKTSSKLVSVFTDGINDKSTYISKLLARQTVYRLGLKTLIIPMSFVNNLPAGTVEAGTFMKLMYYIDSGRKLSREVFFDKDNYDVEYLRLPSGLNPIARLNEEKIKQMIQFFAANYFDLIILDIGTTYTEIVMQLIRKSDYLIWVQNSNIDEVFKDVAKSGEKEVFKIDWEYGMDHAALTADDLIMHIYGEIL